jgi:phage recombination protein Bet
MNTVALTRSASLVERTAQRFGVDPDKLLSTLKKTAFKSASGDVSNEQMMALLIVAERHNLDPFTKEIYAYPDKGGGIVPVVGVDGWIRKVQEHPQFDGWEFDFDAKEGAMTCTIWRKDRSRPTKITEYIAECRRDTPPWKQSPRRMIRNRSIAQCARVAFGFAGIHEEDEAQAMVFDMPKSDTTAQRVREALRPQTVERVPDDDGVIDMAATEFASSRLQEFLSELPACDDDAAALLLDEARTALTDADYAILAGAYRARITPETDDNDQ